MSIPEYARVNFNTLLRAAACGDLALVECADAMTGEPRYVICAVAQGVGHLAPDNPHEAYKPPLTSPDGGEPRPAPE